MKYFSLAIFAAVVAVSGVNADEPEKCEIKWVCVSKDKDPQQLTRNAEVSVDEELLACSGGCCDCNGDDCDSFAIPTQKAKRQLAATN